MDLKTFLSLMLAPLLAATVHAGTPLIMAHRGASHAAPENTLSAFRLAWEEGADGIEGDFQLSSDGEIVCIHDKDTLRVAGKKLIVADTSWAELSKLDVGSWKDAKFAGEKLPRLADVLDVLPAGKKFFLEIKSGPSIVEPIRAVLEAKKADPKRVILIAFDPEVIRACREKIPAFEAHLISSLKDVDQAAKAGEYKKGIEASGAQGLQFDCKAPVAKEWLTSLKLPLTSWTVDDVATAKKVIGLGVANLTTNRPGPLRQELSAQP